jgi:hypothetical protein
LRGGLRLGKRLLGYFYERLDWGDSEDVCTTGTGLEVNSIYFNNLRDVIRDSLKSIGHSLINGPGLSQIHAELSAGEHSVTRLRNYFLRSTPIEPRCHLVKVK